MQVRVRASKGTEEATVIDTGAVAGPKTDASKAVKSAPSQDTTEGLGKDSTSPDIVSVDAANKEVTAETVKQADAPSKADSKLLKAR